MVIPHRSTFLLDRRTDQSLYCILSLTTRPFMWKVRTTWKRTNDTTKAFVAILHEGTRKIRTDFVSRLKSAVGKFPLAWRSQRAFSSLFARTGWYFRDTALPPRGWEDPPGLVRKKDISARRSRRWYPTPASAYIVEKQQERPASELTHVVADVVHKVQLTTFDVYSIYYCSLTELSTYISIWYSMHSRCFRHGMYEERCSRSTLPRGLPGIFSSSHEEGRLA